MANDDDKFTKLLEAFDKKDERRHCEIIILTQQTDKNLKMTREFIRKDLNMTWNIKQEMKTTRMMIHTKYHLFGAMMSALISMMAALLTNSMIEPWKLSPQTQTSISILIMLITLFISFGVWFTWGKNIFFEENFPNRNPFKKPP